MKKKLTEAYEPDKTSRKGRIVVGLSGGYESFVAAYLLKIQKYEVFGVTIATGWDQYSGDKSATLSCHLDEQKLASIREFCNQLHIPHFLVKANLEFQENVVESWMASKVTGTAKTACWNCHDMRMSLLHQKMLDLDAKYMATGHFAKLFHHEGHGTSYVHTSNDEENDQSVLLSRLPKDILNSLKLPLSDLQRKEVLKLAENFGLNLLDKKVKIHDCFPASEATIEFLTKKVPARYSKHGDISNLENTEVFAEHQGIISYDYGHEVLIPASTKRDRYYLVKFNIKDKKLIVSKDEYFLRNRLLLVDCHISQETPWIEPMKGFIRLNERDTVECWIYPKSLNAAYVEWEGNFPLK